MHAIPMFAESDPESDIADAIVQNTEIWPSTAEVPKGTDMGEIIFDRTAEQELDLTYFTRQATKVKRPAILFIHGGGWWMGDKKQFYRQAIHLTRKYDLFSVCMTYRLSGIAKYPAALMDCKTAVRWIRSVADQYQVDTNRIAACGGSAGAHLAALVALTPEVKKFDRDGPCSAYSSEVQLAILFNGHFDLVGQLEGHVQDAGMYKFFGAHPWERPDLYGEASPILWVKPNSPPMLFLHGDKDHYPYQQSVAMAERLRYYGSEAELEIYPGKEHAWFNLGPDCEITTKRIEEFIKKHFVLKAIPGEGS